MIKIACAQMNVFFNDPMANAERAVKKLEELAVEGVKLVVFPEAFLTGYCVETREKAVQIAIPRDHDTIFQLERACMKLGLLAVVGFAEQDGKNLYNCAVLLEPGVEPRFYRKSHLPELGLDNYVCVGNELEVFDTAIGKIGILICFDMRPPEATRTLALKGAELVVLPTNWPEGAEASPEHIVATRAAENRVFFAACNRVGLEGEFRFIGKSAIVGVTGRILASAGTDEVDIVAEVDLREARSKRNVTVPGKFETAIFDTRRPDLYGIITEKKS